MADDLLRRRERELAAAPGDRGASARLAAARVRAGETPPAERTLQALERVARGLRGSSSRAAALAQVAWGRARTGGPGAASLLAAEVADLGPAEHPAQDLWIGAQARAGAALVRAGRGREGRSLLAGAGAALHALDEAWSDLPRLHTEVLRACRDAGLGGRELRALLPGIQRSVQALVVGVVHGRTGLDRQLLQALELTAPVLEGLSACAPERSGRLTALARLTAARVQLEALTAAQARGWTQALEEWVARGPEVGGDDAGFDPLEHLIVPALPTAGLAPASALEGWSAALERERRAEHALSLRLLALELEPAPGSARLERLLEAALDEQLNGHPEWSAVPGRPRARLLARLTPLLARLPAADAGLSRLLEASRRFAPLARGDVLHALARVAGDPGREELLGQVAGEARALLEQPAPPAWAACDALAGAAEAALRGGDPALLGELVALVRETMRRADAPAFQYGGARALLHVAAGAAGRTVEARAWRREALEVLPELVGQDLEDAATDGARALGACPDPAWGAEGLAELAEALAAARAPGLTDRHLLPPLTAIVERLGGSLDRA